MKKDIPQPKLEGVAIVIAPRQDAPDDELWDSYLLNQTGHVISNVLVSSRGYGTLDGERMSTTTLRHFFEEVPPDTLIRIEPVQSKLFEITNEYWLSCNLRNHMYDKKYIFVPGSISSDNFTQIPLLDREGIMIR
jgi:hypothetical protein